MGFKEKASSLSWLATVAGKQSQAARLLALPEREQIAGGYFFTLREMLQQPATWIETGNQMASAAAELLPSIERIQTVVLTGSGSSEYAGECVRLVLQNELGAPVQTIGGGMLLTNGGKAIAPGRPGLMVSLARSGDSPESAGALSLMLETEPALHHLILTCNANGRLATGYRDEPHVKVIVLAERTNDSSLVMTSSFTNLVLAARSLGMLRSPEEYRALTRKLSSLADNLLSTSLESLACLARRNFQQVVYLADGWRIGGAKEAALKMIEMTSGRVTSFSETYLGLRHGPMSAVRPDTLVVCFLSSDPLKRAFEQDLICELNQKNLGMAKLFFGDQIPHNLVGSQDVVVECPGLSVVGDENAPVLDVLVGQILAFFRCQEENLHPDAPSESAVIHRVVQEFDLHSAMR